MLNWLGSLFSGSSLSNPLMSPVMAFASPTPSAPPPPMNVPRPAPPTPPPMPTNMLAQNAVEPSLAPAMQASSTPAPVPMSSGDFDLLVRTVWGEARSESPVGQRAVASVILNRAAMAQQPIAEVITPSQFEPWSNPEMVSKMESLKPDSKAYKSIAANIMPALSRDDPVLNQLTHFYSPKAQESLGRPAPKWDDGSGIDIGQHRFFSREYAGAEPGGELSAFAGPEQSVQFPEAEVGVRDGRGAAANMLLAQGQDDIRLPIPRPDFELGTATNRPAVDTAPDRPLEIESEGETMPQDQARNKPPEFDTDTLMWEARRRGLDVSGITSSQQNEAAGLESPEYQLTEGPAKTHAALRGFVKGVPVAGPALAEIMDRGGALVRSFKTGKPIAEEAAAVGDLVKRLEKEHPNIDFWSQLAGGVAGLAPLIAVSPAAFGLRAAPAVTKVAQRLGPGIASKALPAASRLAAGGASGGVISAADVAARGGDIEDIEFGTKLGAALGAAAPFVPGRASGRLWARLRGQRTPLHREGAATTKIFGAGSEAYNAPPVKELTLKWGEFRKFSNDVLKPLMRESGGEAIPAIKAQFGKLDRRLNKTSANNLTWDEFQTYRSNIWKIARESKDDHAKQLAREMTMAMDDYIDTAGKKAFAKGDYDKAKPFLDEGKSLWKAGHKSELIDGAINRARRSEANIGIALRDEFRGISNNDKLAAMFTQEERTLIDRVASLNKTERILDTIGDLRSMTLGGGVTVGLSFLFGGQVAAGVAGTAAGAMIPAARGGTSAIVKKQVSDTAKAIRPPNMLQGQTLQSISPKPASPVDPYGLLYGTSLGHITGNRLSRP